MRIEVRLDEADLVAAYRLIGRRNTRQARPAIALATILAAIVVALTAMYPDARAAFGRSPLLAGLLGAVLLAAGLLAALVAALPLLFRRAARHTLAEHPGMADPIAYEIGEDRLGIVTSRSQANYRWDELHGWREDERIVLILLTRQLFYVVPKAQVEPAALDALRARLGRAMT
jgi:membrane protein implicated in regulation of membrane protease activity